MNTPLFNLRTFKDNGALSSPNKFNKLKNNVLNYLFEFVDTLKIFELGSTLCNKRLVLVAMNRKMYFLY